MRFSICFDLDIFFNLSSKPNKLEVGGSYTYIPVKVFDDLGLMQCLACGDQSSPFIRFYFELHEILAICKVERRPAVGKRRAGNMKHSCGEVWCVAMSAVTLEREMF